MAISWHLAKGIDYLIRPDASRASLPRIAPERLPADRISVGEGAMAAAGMFRLDQLRKAVGVVGWLTLFETLIVIYPADLDHLPLERREPILLGMLLGVVLSTVASVVVLPKLVEHWHPRQHLLLSLLSYMNKSTEGSVRGRGDLIQIGRLLNRTATRIDAGDGGAELPHPLATLLRAGSGQVHGYLGNSAYLAHARLDELDAVLDGCILALVKPELPELRAFGTSIGAFDESGVPRSPYREMRPRRLTGFLSRLESSLDRAKGMAAAVAIITLVATTTLLAVLGRLDLNEMLGFLR